MKKILSLILISVFMLASVSCITPPADDENDPNALTVLLDSSVTAIGFEKDIQAGIDEMQSSMDAGYTENNVTNRMILENTKLLRDWADSKEINLNCKTWGWGDSLTNKLQSAFFAKDTPDLVIGETQMPSFAQKGYLQEFPEDLSNYIKENCLSLSYAPMTIDGKIYGVALAPSVTVLLWNKDMLARAGVSQSIIDNGPANWEEWDSAMAAVAANGENAGGVYTGPGKSDNGAFLRSGTLMLAGGGGFADETGAPNINSPENIEAFEFIRKMAGYNKPGMLNAQTEDSYFSYFKTGKMAYYVDGSWAINDAKDLNFDVGYCLMPTKDGSGDGSTIAIGCVYLSVPIYAKNSDRAWDLIRFFLSSEIQTNLARGGARFPALRSASQSVYADTSSEYYQEHFAAYKTLSDAVSNQNVTSLPPFVMDNGKLSNIWTAAGQLLGKLADPKNNDSVTSLAQAAQAAMMTEWNKK